MSDDSLQARAKTFAALHRGPDILMLPNAWDVGGAVVMAEAGFPAIATTSAGIAFAQGYQDGEKMGRERMLEVAGRIAEAVSVPVTVDLESGYGSAPENVAETVRQAMAAGLVGGNFEDGTIGGDTPLFDMALATERVRAARAAADAADVAFVVNARTDPYLRLGGADAETKFAEAVARGQAYREAGADCIFVPGVADVEAIAALVREIDAPVNVLGAFSRRVPAPLAELARIGIRRVSLGGSLALAVLRMIETAMAEIRETGCFDYAGEAFSNAEMNKLMAR